MSPLDDPGSNLRELNSALALMTEVVSGCWEDTMKTPTMWRSKFTARGYEELHSDEGCFAATSTGEGIRMVLARCLDKRDQGHEALCGRLHTSFFSTLMSVKANSCTHNHLNWNSKILTDGRRVVWRVHKAMLGLRTSPRRWSGKLKNMALSKMSVIRVCFVNTELDICIGVHVDDMLAVGPSELTKNLL